MQHSNVHPLVRVSHETRLGHVETVEPRDPWLLSWNGLLAMTFTICGVTVALSVWLTHWVR